MYVDGQLVESKSDDAVIPVLNPATQRVIAMLPECKKEEFQIVVDSSKKAFESWSKTPVPVRARVMFRYQELIRRDMDRLAECIVEEQGKTLDDAKGDVFRGLGMWLARGAFLWDCCGLGRAERRERERN